MNNKDKKFIFSGKIVRNIYMSDKWKIYAVDVDKEQYPSVKHTKYGDCSVCGDIQTLIPGEEYNFTCTEQTSQYGYSYKILNITKDKPKNESDVYTFLQEFLTFNQASELYREYPQIIDLVLNGEDDKIDLGKLHGIGEKTFEKIKQKIIDNYKLFDIVAEYGGILTLSMIKKLYDAFSSVDKIKTALRIKPYSALTRISGIGFKKADELLLKLEKENKIKFEFDLRTSKERCLACIMYFLEDNETSKGNTKIELSELRGYVNTLTPACKNHFIDCIKENQKIIYCNPDTLEVALRRTYNTEKYISDTIKTALKINQKWDINYEDYRNNGEFPLSDEQVKSLGLICNNQISILCGYAGSGKTYTTTTLIQMLLDNNKTFMLLSPTGRAAKVLSGYTKMPASTIHRGYLYNPSDGWYYNEENKVDCDIIIADEMSMCDVFLFKHLLEGIDFNKTKLFIIGDPCQLCSVGAGNLLNDLINSNIIPSIFLNKIFRYNEGGLMQAATDTRNCKVYLPKEVNKPVILGENKDYIFWNCDKKQMLDNLTDLYKQLLSQGYTPNDIAVISAQNVGDYGTIAINNILQKLANKNYGSKNFLKSGDTIFYEGDLVMQTKNNYHSPVYIEGKYFDDDERPETLIANGEIGVIKELTRFYVIIDFDGTLIQYKYSDMDSVVLGYSYTCHRSQGGSAKIVIFLSCSSHTFMMSSNLSYVGLTRTREKCFHLGNLKTINLAIKKKENLQRKTFLEDLLKNKNS